MPGSAITKITYKKMPGLPKHLHHGKSIIIKEKLCPVVLTHIFILVGVDGSGIQLGKAVVVTVENIDIDSQRIVAASDGGLG
ncbi:MAG: hypothetical protein J5819_07075, partial [Eubacterium sp.]|nr:hypothetical protein [Eubacterium sp.]